MTEENRLRMKLCRVKGCKAPATRGSWYIPDAMPRVVGIEPRFSYTLLCAEHGERAVKRGAKKLNWRPGP